MSMLASFEPLADTICSLQTGQEVICVNFRGETSDFVRLNHNRIRQAGQVRQATAEIELIDGRRHLSAGITLCGDRQADEERAGQCVQTLRSRLGQIPEDPYLLYNRQPRSGNQIGQDRLPPAAEMLEQIQDRCQGQDLVGILAAGGIHAGFANSLGQRNWFSAHTFHFDWCFYHQADKAVKSSYGGFDWDPQILAEKVETASEQLEILRSPPRKIPRGKYRVYLAPAALEELVGLLAWGGFGLKDRKTRNSSLLRMAEGQAEMDPAVTIRENTAGGMAPNFQSEGFVKPDAVTLIDGGRLADCLVSPRSAREYDVATNAASAGECPESIEMDPGSIDPDDVLEALDTGLYINTLWYGNYSDKPGCRITGMTRFATFWVEGGRIVAPVEVMRFDETMYHVLGDGLIGLTSGREFLPSSGTYVQRSTQSSRLPGALVSDFTFTL
jgi:predicted Zn-dependent protease